MERAERLWPDGPRYRYDEQCFPPSTDSFLLGGFASLRRGEKVCDLGAGAGLLGLLLLAREPSLQVTGIERDAHACAVLARNAAENRLPLTALCAAARRSLSAGGVQSALFRAPYGSGGEGRPGRHPRGADRHAGGYLCRRRTNAAMGRTLLPCVPAGASGGAADRRRDPRSGAQAASDGAAHRPERPVAGAAGMPGLSVEPPLLLRLEDGGESHDVRRAYFRDKE